MYFSIFIFIFTLFFFFIWQCFTQISFTVLWICVCTCESMSGRKKLVFRLLSLSSYIFVLRYNSALFLTNVENIIRNSLHPPVDIFRSTHVQSTDLCFPYDDSVLYSVAQRCYSVVLTCSFCSLLCAHFVSVYKCWFDTHKAEECVCCRLPCARVSFCVLSWYLWQLFFSLHVVVNPSYILFPLHIVEYHQARNHLNASIRMNRLVWITIFGDGNFTVPMWKSE